MQSIKERVAFKARALRSVKHCRVCGKVCDERVRNFTRIGMGWVHTQASCHTSPKARPSRAERIQAIRVWHMWDGPITLTETGWRAG